MDKIFLWIDLSNKLLDFNYIHFQSSPDEASDRAEGSWFRQTEMVACMLKNILSGDLSRGS